MHSNSYIVKQDSIIYNLSLHYSYMAVFDKTDPDPTLTCEYRASANFGLLQKVIFALDQVWPPVSHSP